RNSPASSWRPAPLARDANTATGVSSPTPMMKKRLKTPTPKDDAARGTAPVRPIITLSAIPMSIWPTWPMTIGTARSSVARDSRMTSFIDEIYSGPAGVVHRYLRRRAAPPRGAGAPSAHLAHADRVHLRRRVRRREPDDLGRAAGERERLPRGRAPDPRAGRAGAAPRPPCGRRPRGRLACRALFRLVAASFLCSLVLHVPVA